MKKIIELRVTSNDEYSHKSAKLWHLGGIRDHVQRDPKIGPAYIREDGYKEWGINRRKIKSEGKW